MINEEKLKEYIKAKAIILKNKKSDYNDALESMKATANTALHDTGKVMVEANNVTLLHTQYTDLDLWLFQLCGVLGEEYTNLLETALESDE